MPYIGRSTDGFGVRNRFLYLASASDTSVSGADANGATLTFTDGAYVDVYLNGVLLKAGTDYNTNTANTIAGLASMAANDEVTVIVYDVFTVGDMVSATSGGTFSGAITFSSTVSGLDVNGTEIILDADGDTTITADTDDQIDIKIAGADDFQFTANTFTALSGSTIAAQALTATTITATGDVSLDGGSFVFNESSADKDFRVESNGNTHMLFVDGGNDGVGIGTSSVDTASTLTVSNTSDAHGITIVGAVNKSRMQFQGANTGSASTDGLVIGLSSSDDTNDDSALIGLKESGSMTFQTSGTNHMIIDGAGHVTKPSSAMWWAHDTSNNNAANSSAGAYETFVFDSETYDIGGGYNPSNGRYVAPVAGKYYVSSKLLIQGLNSNTTYYIDIAIFVNGSQKLREASRLNTYPRAQTMSVSGLVHCDASDYIEVQLRLENASNQVVYAAQTTAYFQGFLVG